MNLVNQQKSVYHEKNYIVANYLCILLLNKEGG